MSSHKPAPCVTRFAPSPTGHLHLGHAYSAITAHDRARKEGGRFLLRIEDIDTARSRPQFEKSIMDDLRWLGLEWETPVIRQSERMDIYRAALNELDDMGLLYQCFCTRKDIMREIEAAPSAPHAPASRPANGVDGPIYPGICRGLEKSRLEEKMASGEPYALRLDMQKAISVAEKMAGGGISWTDETAGEIAAKPEIFGDIVLARKDTPASYHLAVSVDDHFQGVSLVTRGRDLFEATHIHRLLQVLLRLDSPIYSHHKLVEDENGKRLAKRDNSLALGTLRQSGVSPDKIREMLA